MNSLQQVHRYKFPGAPGNDPYSRAKVKPMQNAKAKINKFRCRREPNVRCYKTPRRVKIQKCEEVKEQKCQKVTNTNPRPVQHETCHDEPYEECEVEKQQQSKIVQVPVYEEECNSVPRELCDNQGSTTLEVKCVDETKPVCEWQPKEAECRKTPREHCFKMPYQVKTMDCDESYKEKIGLPRGGEEAPYGGFGDPYGKK
jgi:hypothetical protein